MLTFALLRLCRFVECEPEVRQVRLTDQDSFLVLASDGLWDVMTDAEAVQSVQVSCPLYLINVALLS